MTFKILSTLTLCLFFLISCGGDDNQQQEASNMTNESSEAKEQANQPKEDPRWLGKDGQPKPIERNPNAGEPTQTTHPNLAKSEEVHPNDIEEGTCEYAAYIFAEYFTMGDSNAVFPLCTDSMKQVVRIILQDTMTVRTMRLNREAGYTISGVSTAVKPDRPTADCQACLRAQMWGETREDCNFYFIKKDGEWLLSGFK